ncbi:MAG: hypothetical protein H0V25_10910 [Solirubrobacterales bacterium]|nr:hypothetical protein [Solirubrobacterales bacterium]
MSRALKPEDTRDALRKIGVVLFAIGALMVFLRKGDDWGNFPILLVLGIPALALYGAGVLTIKDTGGLQSWQAVSTVLGLIFIPLALMQLVDTLGGSSSSLNVFWIFGLTAAAGVYAGVVAGVRFGLLVAAIAAIVSWSALWDKLLGDEGIGGHIGVYRGLLGILAILLIAGGVFIWRAASDREEGLSRFSELFTGAGISAVIACSLGITSVATVFGGVFPTPVVETNMFWDILLLVISIGLVAIGSRLGTRGPVYVGAVGLLLFLYIAGLDLNDDSPEPTKLGLWPLILLLGGGAAIAASLSEGVSLGKRPQNLVKKTGG